MDVAVVVVVLFMDASSPWVAEPALRRCCRRERRAKSAKVDAGTTIRRCTHPGGVGRCSRHARRLKAATLAAAVSAVVVLLTACGGSGSGAPRVSPLDDDAITVGSFDFAESVVVAEVYSQGLEAAGFKVNRAFSLGPREFVGPALRSGLVEFVPEYAGTAVGVLQHRDSRADRRCRARRTSSSCGPSTAIPLSRSRPLRLEDSNTFVVTESTARSPPYQVAQRLVGDCRPADVRRSAGVPDAPAVPGRPRKTYGLKFRQVITLDAGGPLTRPALRRDWSTSR